jgi:hypothetical protein
MYSCKVFLTLLMLWYNQSYLPIKPPVLVKWVVSKECSLKVSGSTNINQFACVIPGYKGGETLTFLKGPGSVILTGLLSLDVSAFDCHNRGMTGELRKALKAKEYPYLTIRFVSLSRYPDEQPQLTGVVIIELAGVSKRYNVDYKFKKEGEHGLSLLGLRKVNFSDFNLTPPRKLGGIIQTNNELNVEFNLKVKVE